MFVSSQVEMMFPHMFECNNFIHTDVTNEMESKTLNQIEGTY